MVLLLLSASIEYQRDEEIYKIQLGSLTFLKAGGVFKVLSEFMLGQTGKIKVVWLENGS